MKTLQSMTLAATTIGLTSLSWAHDGHDHGPRRTPARQSASGFYDDHENRVAYPNEPYRMESFAPSSRTCPQGGSCCGAGHEETPERFIPSTAAGYTSGVSLSRTDSPTFAQLERLLNRLQNDLRDESRDLRGQSILLDDNANLTRETRHFSQSVDNGAEVGHLRADAANVKKALIQLDVDMERQGRFPQSENTLRNFAKLFVTLESELGLRGRTPARNSASPLPPTDAPFNPSQTRSYNSQGPSEPRWNASPRLSKSTIPEDMKGIALLSPSDQATALAQDTCPVTKQKLGSMGKPIRVSVAGRSLWVCCAGCINAVQSNPEKYLRN